MIVAIVSPATTLALALAIAVTFPAAGALIRNLSRLVCWLMTLASPSLMVLSRVAIFFSAAAAPALLFAACCVSRSLVAASRSACAFASARCVKMSWFSWPLKPASLATGSPSLTAVSFATMTATVPGLAALSSSAGACSTASLAVSTGGGLGGPGLGGSGLGGGTAETSSVCFFLL